MGVDDGLSVVAARQPTGALEVLAVGELDVATAPQLVDCVLGDESAAPGDVVIVLSGVTFVDSTGIVALLDIRDTLVRAGRRLTLAAPSESVRQVIDLMDLGDHFHID